MKTYVKLFLELLQWLKKERKTPKEIKDEAIAEVADNSLDDDIDVIRDGMRD